MKLATTEKHRPVQLVAEVMTNIQLSELGKLRGLVLVAESGSEPSDIVVIGTVQSVRGKSMGDDLARERRKGRS